MCWHIENDFTIKSTLLQSWVYMCVHMPVCVSICLYVCMQMYVYMWDVHVEARSQPQESLFKYHSLCY